MVVHPLPTIGTKYIRLSDEALCLDAASVSRIQASCVERPEKPQHRPPKAIRTTAPAKVSRYLRSVDASAARHTRALADWEAYVHVPVVEASYHVLNEPAPRQRLFVLLAGKSSKLCESGMFFADIMTGCLFNDTGECLSSGRLRIYPNSADTVSRKDAAKYIEMRKPRYNADESEA